MEIEDPEVNKKLLKAVQNSDFETVKSLKDCDYNCTLTISWTALEISCSGSADIVKYLLRKGVLS